MHARFSRDEQAVSSVIGDILLVGITVTMAVGLSLMVMAFEGPQHERPASVDVTFEAGLGGWGTGDEQVVLRHRGGLPLEASEMSLVIDVNGSRLLVLPPATEPFADGRMTIGEQWVVTQTLSGGQAVTAMLVHRGVGSVAIAYGGFTPDMSKDCSSDVTGPKVALWTQVPSDAQGATVGPVTVAARLSDDCSGVKTSASPVLSHRIQDGTSPPWTDVPTTLVVGTTFSAQVPEPPGGWAAAAGKTLEYRLLTMTDLAGNTADSSVRTDFVQTATAYTFPACPPAFDPGSISNCPDLQDDNDGGAEARLDEAAVPGSATNVLYATTVTATPPTVNQGAAKGAPDNAYAVLPTRGDRSIVGGFATASGAIQKVEIFYEGHRQGSYVDDQVRLRYRLGGSLAGSFLDINPTATDSVASLDVTADRAWTWAQIANMDVDAEFRRIGGEDGIDIYVDALWVRVTADATAYDLQGELAFAGVPGATIHTLELRYRVFTDTFSVQVWNGSAWNTRGPALTATTATAWTPYDLSAAEYLGGAPKIRFIDRDTQPASAGQLLVDYVRIKST